MAATAVRTKASEELERSRDALELLLGAGAAEVEVGAELVVSSGVVTTVVGVRVADEKVVLRLRGRPVPDDEAVKRGTVVVALKVVLFAETVGRGAVKLAEVVLAEPEAEEEAVPPVMVKGPQ